MEAMGGRFRECVAGQVCGTIGEAKRGLYHDDLEWANSVQLIFLTSARI